MSGAGKVLLIGSFIVVSIISAAIVSNVEQQAQSNPVEQTQKISNNCQSKISTLRFSMSSNNKHPIFAGASKFKELVEKETDLTVDIYPSAQLGDDRAAIEMLQLGTLDISIPSTGPLANFYPEYNVFDLPFMINSEAIADKVLRSLFAENMLNLLQSKQLIGLDFWENGFRHLTNSSRAITSIEEVKGLKIRTMESALHLDAWHALGAIPTPMAFNELFTALQQGTVDGQENPYPNIALNNLFEVQGHLSDTGHVYTPLVLIFSAKTWNKLSKYDQSVIKRSAKIAGDFERKVNREVNQQSLMMIKKHMQVTKLTAAAKKEFQLATQPVINKYQDVIGKALIDDFLQAIINAEQAGSK